MEEPPIGLVDIMSDIREGNGDQFSLPSGT